MNNMPWKPSPLITFGPVWAIGRQWIPNFGDKNSLLIMRRQVEKRVSFARAYCGWRNSGAHEEKELGEGRAFLRWLQKHHLSIGWIEKDFSPHPYFSGPDSPKHDKNDEMAKGLSFAIKPILVGEKKVKLYVRDEDVLSLLSLNYGNEVDFLELVKNYVSYRHEWEKWKAPAPLFLDWVVSHGKRPVFGMGQLGLDIATSVT
jgi:hypothetical protein